MTDPSKKQPLLSTFDMPCQVCKEPSKSQCPSCRTPYCSKACQRIDWKRGHKKDCKELTLEFKRGYDYVEPKAKKKEAPPVVVIPDKVKPTVNVKQTEPRKPAVEEKSPSGGESCPICLEIFPPSHQLLYKTCCGNSICRECEIKCAEANPICPLCRKPAARNDAETLVRLQGRVDKGDKVAQFNLGCTYRKGGYGLKKSRKRAAQLFELSAAQGYALAQFNIGLCYYNGIGGVKMDKQKALKYYMLAAKQGYADAQFNSGYMYAYYDGEGFERDFEKALNYWELAAAQGHQQAQRNVAALRGAK